MRRHIPLTLVLLLTTEAGCFEQAALAEGASGATDTSDAGTGGHVEWYDVALETGQVNAVISASE